MRKLVIAAALASTLAATPAIARDNSWYVGVEGGLMKVEKEKLDFDGSLGTFNNIFDIDHNTGVDADLIAGYDLGMFRLEGELGYKRASLDDVDISEEFEPSALETEIDGRTRVWSGMLNGMLDLGDDDGWSGFLGGGVGLARLSMKADITGIGVLTNPSFSGSDRSFAWQAVAGIRAPVTDNIDLGLKYRFFTTKFDFEESGDQLDGRFRSHSLLASLVYNFAAPAAPPPPPPPPAPPAPPPPATQTCPDGSVILATDTCPVPPPPPPPPPPAPERG